MSDSKNTSRHDRLQAELEARFPALPLHAGHGELTLEVAADALLDTATVLRDEPALGFAQLIDLAGVDYLTFGLDEWDTNTVSNTGFSRGVARSEGESSCDPQRRFAVSYHLLSVSNNWRLRLKVFLSDSDPRVPSVNDLWAAANWFEREAFDLYGILFEGHPDLRRILTDYGFIGHPFRKDFPLTGNIEVRYDEEKKRVVYEPVSIEPRVLVPRVIRDDSRYEPGEPADDEAAANG